MTLRTDLTDGLLQAEVHAAQHNEAATLLNAVAPAALLRSKYDLGYVAVPDSTATFLEFGTAGQSDDIFDFTDPAHPTVKTEGVYAVKAHFDTPAAAGKSMWVELDLDATGDDPFTLATFSIDVGDTPETWVDHALSLTYFVPQGGEISVAVKHNVGAMHDVQVFMTVQMLTPVV